MAFDGSSSRQVRQRGVVHRIYVRQVRCGRWGAGETLLPDLTLRRCSSDGAAVLARHRHCSGSDVQALYTGVPARMVRCWHQRFFERADDLMIRFEARRAQWGDRMSSTRANETASIERSRSTHSQSCRSVSKERRRLQGVTALDGHRRWRKPGPGDFSRVSTAWRAR